MNAILPVPGRAPSCSEAARERLLNTWGEPWLHSDWLRAVFIHFEVEPESLQRKVPFALDLREGKAYVSLVAFTMRRLRPRLGGRAGAWLFAPIATHGLLNVRTYVRHEGETGIHFIAEWIPNRLSELIGPLTFGLPYRHGCLAYDHDHERGRLAGQVTACRARFAYRAGVDPADEFRPAAADTRTNFLLERYTAFTSAGARRKFFRVWHPPWMQAEIDIEIEEDSLLRQSFDWYAGARLAGANYSPGLEQVWMGRPHWFGGGQSLA